MEQPERREGDRDRARRESDRESNHRRGRGGRFSGRPMRGGRRGIRRVIRRGDRRGRGMRRRFDTPRLRDIDYKKEIIETIDSEMVKEMNADYIQPESQMYGTQGDEVDIITNYYHIGMKINRVLQYKVIFTPPLPEGKPRIGNRVLNLVREELFGPRGRERAPHLFDGYSLLLCLRPLKEIPYAKKICYEGEEIQIRVERPSEEEMKGVLVGRRKIHFRNIIMRNMFNRLGYWSIGRIYYNKRLGMHLRRVQTKVMLGFISTMLNAPIGNLLNIDLCYKSLRTQNLWEYIKSLRSQEFHKGKDERWKRICAEKIHGCYAYCPRFRRNRIYRIHSIEWDKSPSYEIKTRRSEEKIPLSKYYEMLDRERNSSNRLRLDPAQPLLRIVPRKYIKIHKTYKVLHENITDENCVFFLPQLMFRTGVDDQIREDFEKEEYENTRRYKHYTRFDADRRIKDIFNIVKNQLKRGRYPEMLGEFGIKQEAKLVKVKGRVLKGLSFNLGKGENGKRERIPSTNGLLPIHAISSLFRNPPNDLGKWLVVCGPRINPKSKKGNVNFFLKEMKNYAQTLGLSFGKMAMVKLESFKKEHVQEKVREKIEKQEISLVLAIWSSKRLEENHDVEDETNTHKVAYRTLKNLLTTNEEHPIPIQVVLNKTINRYLPETDEDDEMNEREKELEEERKQRHLNKLKHIFRNIMIQIVSKLGGSPWAVPLLKEYKQLMVCGINTFGIPQKERGFRSRSSVVGFVSSRHFDNTRFYSQSWVYAPKQREEISEQLKHHFKESMEKFKENSKAKEYPKYVAFYRDGVGEFQRQNFIRHELDEIKEGIKELGAKTKVLFICVKKRIHARLFKNEGEREVVVDHARGEKEKRDVFGNPHVGTVVDTDITDRRWCEFVLVSQAHRSDENVSSTPTKYLVFENEGFSMDDIQTLTFKLTHLYYNFNGSIRVPAVCQYARKLAEKRALYIRESANEQLSENLWYL